MHEVPVSSDFPSSLFDEGRITISDLSMEKAESYKDEIEKGSIDYSKLVEDHGAVFTSDSFMDEYGLK